MAKLVKITRRKHQSNYFANKRTNYHGILDNIDVDNIPQ